MDTTLNSIALSAADAGRGLPLVFLHGFPLSRGAWREQIDAFRASYRVIAPDLRGVGDSGTQPGPATMAQCAADVHALLRQLTTGPVVLIGHSMGGYVALAFARRFPDMLRGLVLVGTRAGPDTAEGATGRRETAAKVKAGGVDVVIDAMALRMLAAGNQDASMLEQVRGLMTSSTPAGVIGALLGMARVDLGGHDPRDGGPALMARVSRAALRRSPADSGGCGPRNSPAGYRSRRWISNGLGILAENKPVRRRSDVRSSGRSDSGEGQN